jgi:hypothetical protein
MTIGLGVVSMGGEGSVLNAPPGLQPYWLAERFVVPQKRGGAGAPMPALGPEKRRRNSATQDKELSSKPNAYRIALLGFRLLLIGDSH